MPGKSPAKVGLPRERFRTGDRITPGDFVCRTRSIQCFQRQEWRNLPPTWGLAGIGSRLRWFHQSTNGPRSPVLSSLTEWALPPPRRTDCPSVKVRLEQARRRHTAARETSLRRRRRLELNQRRVDDAERAEQETSAELTNAGWAAGAPAPNAPSQTRSRCTGWGKCRLCERPRDGAARAVGALLKPPKPAAAASELLSRRELPLLLAMEALDALR